MNRAGEHQVMQGIGTGTKKGHWGFELPEF